MIPDPLHPAVVHFPIALMFLVPAVALVALWTIRHGARVSRAWLVPVCFAGALAVSAWVALETGEDQEERVERVVSEGVIGGHQEAAETFLILSAALFVVSAAGLVRGRVGATARWVATFGAVGVLAAGVRVGHSGGMLVYQHGAASAYATPSPGGNPLRPATEARGERGGE